MLDQPIYVACLCAAWCRLCDDYAPVLEQVAGELAAAGVPLRWHWIDIEDEAVLVSDFDVETFPTIVIADAQHVRFAGPLTPQADTLRRLLRALVVEAPPGRAWPTLASPVEAFAQRLRAHSSPDGRAR
ncbi:MAG TPA: thioredoxin domain-containing protein [Rubrivivax sp.]|nr:thioredoxin domain-containing protein [Rubrivivax sp.]